MASAFAVRTRGPNRAMWTAGPQAERWPADPEAELESADPEAEPGPTDPEAEPGSAEPPAEPWSSDGTDSTIFTQSAPEAINASGSRHAPTIRAPTDSERASAS